MEQQFLTQTQEQTLYVRLGGRTYKIRLYPFRNLMYIDIVLNEEYVIAGQRVIANTWIIPSYMAGEDGNIRFETYKSDGNDYVWWDGFNTKFRLMCYSKSEIEDMEAKTKET